MSTTFSKSMIIPLTPDGGLYSLQDESGKQIASGSREVCQTLLYLLSNSALMKNPPRMAKSINPRVRLRDEISERN